MEILLALAAIPSSGPTPKACLGLLLLPGLVEGRVLYLDSDTIAAERFIRTLKEQIVHGRISASLQELREELDRFAALYNECWLAQKHGHKTPNQLRAERSKRTLDEGADTLIEGAA